MSSIYKWIVIVGQHVRKFQREYVSRKDVDPHKYSYYAEENHSLMQGNPYYSAYTRDMGQNSYSIVRPEHNRRFYQKPVPRNLQTSANNIKQARPVLDGERDRVTAAEAFTHRPTTNWM